MTQDKLVEIARLGRPHGLKGALHLRLHNPDSALIRAGLVGVLRGPDAAPERPVKITSARAASSGIWLVQLDLCASKEEAQALVHAQLLVKRELLPALDEDEVYLVDLIGLPAFVAASADQIDPVWRAGTITGLLESKANDVLVLTQRSGKEVLIPVIDQAFAQLRPETGRVVLAPLDQWADPDLVLAPEADDE